MASRIRCAHWRGCTRSPCADDAAKIVSHIRLELALQAPRNPRRAAAIVTDVLAIVVHVVGGAPAQNIGDGLVVRHARKVRAVAGA